MHDWPNTNAPGQMRKDENTSTIIGWNLEIVHWKLHLQSPCGLRITAPSVLPSAARPCCWSRSPGTARRTCPPGRRRCPPCHTARPSRRSPPCVCFVSLLFVWFAARLLARRVLREDVDDPEVIHELAARGHDPAVPAAPSRDDFKFPKIRVVARRERRYGGVV